MIEYIKGELTELTPTLAVVEAAGVGYALNISLNTFSGIQGKKDVKLYVHEALVTGGRDDSFTLYGFSTRQERALYQLLITVSGVGANTARMILSASSPAELCNTIANGDERMLKSVKGIGLKTAQRIIVDLRDKIATIGIEGGAEGKRNDERQGVSGEEALQTSIVRDEAIQALLMLGFSPAPSAKVVNAILKDQPSLPVEQVVKLALKMIK
jgi:Holliday junction DNA helicase RuvA